MQRIKGTLIHKEFRKFQGVFFLILKFTHLASKLLQLQYNE